MSFTLIDRSAPRILIRGSGIIGLSIAWSLLQKRIRPMIYDNGDVHQQASLAAAGMLSAGYERFIDPDFSGSLASFGDYSASLWPNFANDLKALTGIDPQYSSGPTFGLINASSYDSKNELIARDHPLLGRGIGKNTSDVLMSFPKDGQVDNRAVMAALRSVCEDCFVSMEPEASQFDIVIECYGWRAAEAVPVKGQMLSLEPRPWHPKVPVRWGERYVTPKSDRTIIGATVEPDICDGRLKDADLDVLFEDACEVLPGLKDGAAVLEKWTGIRPKSKTRAPIMAWQDDRKTFIATGHYRNGILLAPASADYVVSQVLGSSYAGPNIEESMFEGDHGKTQLEGCS